MENISTWKSFSGEIIRKLIEDGQKQTSAGMSLMQENNQFMFINDRIVSLGWFENQSQSLKCIDFTKIAWFHICPWKKKKRRSHMWNPKWKIFKRIDPDWGTPKSLKHRCFKIAWILRTYIVWGVSRYSFRLS